MNKITSTLAGLAIVATASVVPAFAQAGNFNNTAPFTFVDTGTTFTVNPVAATFNPVVAAPLEAGTLTLLLTGGTGAANSNPQFFSTGVLTFTPTNVALATITDTFSGGNLVSFVPTGAPGAGTATAINLAPSANGDQYKLVNGSPVPEASTVISFGALLALGGLAVMMRRKGVKNAA